MRLVSTTPFVSGGSGPALITGNLITSFPTGFSLQRGITFDGTNVYTSNTNTGVITKYVGISNTVDTTFSIDGATSGFGLAFDGTNMIINSFRKIIRAVGISSTADVTLDTLTYNIGPVYDEQGLYWHNGNLISVDTDTDRVLVHDGFSTTITTNFTVTGCGHAVAVDGLGNLLLSSATIGQLKVMNGISSSIQYTLDLSSDGVTAIYGLAYTGTQLLVVCSAGLFVYE